MLLARTESRAGAAAEVTYLGDLDDEPLAIKIVMDDAKDTDEAQINAFVGKVAQLGEDGDHIVLEAQTGDFFTFVSDSILISASTLRVIPFRSSMTVLSTTKRSRL